MPDDEQHPTQSVAPGADPEQSGPAPAARLVDPEEAILAEFLPPTQQRADQRLLATDSSTTT